MYIEILGGSTTQKFYVESMMRFCHEKLFPRMRTLYLNVHIKNFGDDDSCGYCVPTEPGSRPREFDIELNRSLRLRTLLETVGHEMVHVKQYARGELRENYGVGKHLWKGAWVNSNIDYYDLPWEIEAHGRETGLFIRYVEKHKLTAKKWTKRDL